MIVPVALVVGWSGNALTEDSERADLGTIGAGISGHTQEQRTQEWLELGAQGQRVQRT